MAGSASSTAVFKGAGHAMTQRLHRIVAARAIRGTTGVRPLSSNRRRSSHLMAGGLEEFIRIKTRY